MNRRVRSGSLAVAGRSTRASEAEMSIVLLILDVADTPFAVGAHAGGELARLGVTRVVVMQDGATLGVLLEGWAFDSTSTTRAIDALDVHGVQPRVLLPVLDVSVSRPGADANNYDGRSSIGGSRCTT